MPEPYETSFDTQALEDLDRFALLARQDYNLGNGGKWFHHFRGGQIAVLQRLYGVTRHYAEVHAWRPELTASTADYQLASVFFNMDSALECFVFALNALGWGAGGEFRDVADGKALKKIGLRDVRESPLPGYRAVFPSVLAVFEEHRDTITTVTELHDVSKHRQTILTGGRLRSDPPDRFFERIGIDPTDPQAVLVTPYTEIRFQAEAKTPAVLRTPQAYDPSLSLEILTPAYVELIESSFRAAVADAKTNITLRFDELQDLSSER